MIYRSFVLCGTACVAMIRLRAQYASAIENLGLRLSDCRSLRSAPCSFLGHIGRTNMSNPSSRTKRGLLPTPTTVLPSTTSHAGHPLP